MPRETGYLSPLLSNFAVDHARVYRGQLINATLFPRLGVPKPTGMYKTFNTADALHYTDPTLSEGKGEAAYRSNGGKTEPFACKPYGLKEKIDIAENENADAAFKRSTMQAVTDIVEDLEVAQEIRCAALVKNLPATRSTTLTGNGTAKTNIWTVTGANTGGDPYTNIKEAKAKLPIEPNLLIIPSKVFNTMEDHPILINKLGEANMIKVINIETLQKLFNIQTVMIANSKANMQKKNAAGSATLADIWGNNVILAHVSDRKDAPCAGKTFIVEYTEAEGAGYVVREWFNPDSGVKGAQLVRVAHDTAEVFVCADLIYVLKNVIQ